jgi:sulfoxide reductase heme-binding subunit YedZ
MARPPLPPRVLKPIVFAVALVPIALIASEAVPVFLGWRVRSEALGADPIRAVEIATGLWTLRFLAITLAVTPLRQVTGWGWLAKYRRMLGLFTFFYACVHLSTWVALDWFFDWGAMGGEIVKHKYILVGMTTFALMLPLALTSTKGWVRRLGGARWARLHQLVYACAITGTVHYLWAVKKDTLFPLVYLAVFALLLGYRALRSVVPVRRGSLRTPRPIRGGAPDPSFQPPD